MQAGERLTHPGQRRRRAVTKRPVRASSRRGGVIFARLATTLGVLCVVGLVLLGRVAFAAHMLLVPHLVGVDGALVHHGAHGSPHLEGQSSAVPDSGDYASRDDEGDFERCDVLGVREAPPTTTMPPAPARLVAWYSLTASAPTAVDDAGLPLLSLAPKLSPPSPSRPR